ncbi:hypothetical protein TNCV_4723311 [Trichonephila clavipes]|uniref:Uncharacterized protein n=1 Tax=Trichonephila clavipes TaxID=2585209 RepID=A0A8X6W6K7_TRICX|nr:hypothetical protein TNCV_4723311 [Trichonephila clavipes]
MVNFVQSSLFQDRRLESDGTMHSENHPNAVTLKLGESGREQELKKGMEWNRNKTSSVWFTVQECIEI